VRWRALGGLGIWWLVAAGSVLGMGLVVFAGALRTGGLMIAASLFLGAVLRLVIPTPRGGGLEVRRRLLDVGLLLALAVGVLVAFTLVRLTPP
jgi:hypothetical protein